MGCCRDFTKAIIFLLLAGCLIYHSHHYTDEREAKSAPAYEYSHLVRFEQSLGDENPSQPFCSGSLISPHHVLSAAHCFDTMEGVKIDAVLGSDTIDASVEVRSSVKAIYLHPSYVPHLYGNDIAIVELLHPIGSLEPISLTADFSLSQIEGAGRVNASYAGWGSRRAGSKEVNSTSKKSGQLGLVVTAQCGLMMVDELCSVFEGNLSNSPYYGDSGAPVMAKEGHKSWQLGVLVRSNAIEEGKTIIITSLSPHCLWVEKTTGGEVLCEKMASSN